MKFQARFGLIVIVLITFFLLTLPAWANFDTGESHQTWEHYYSEVLDPGYFSRFSIVEYKDRLVLFDHSLGHYNDPQGVFLWDNNKWSSLIDNQWEFSTLRGSVTWRDKLILVASAQSHIDKKVLKLPVWDGTKWTHLDPRISGRFSALVEWQGDLIVAGKFTIDGFPGEHRLARWNGKQWSIIPTDLDGPSPSISALAVYKDDLVIAGSFVAVGHVGAINLASLREGRWQSLGPGANATVNKLAVFKNELYVAGNFTCIGGLALARVARWDGSIWKNLGVDAPLKNRQWLSRIDYVSLLKATDKGLFVVGKFQQVNGHHSPSMALWDGEQWEIQTRWGPVPPGALPPLRGRPGPKESLMVTDVPEPSKPKTRELLAEPKRFFPDSEHTPSGANIQNIAEVSGTIFVTHNAGSRHNGHNAEVSVWSDDAWVNLPSFKKPPTRFSIVGSYNRELLVRQTNPSTREGLLKIWKDDNLRTFLEIPKARIASWHVTDQEILVFGNFRRFAGQPMNAVARFDGMGWRTLGAGIPFDSSKFKKIAGSGNHVYVAGSFRNWGFQTYECLLHWDGSSWQDILALENRYQISDMIAWKDGLVIAEYNRFGYDDKQDETKASHQIARENHSRIRYWDGEKWTTQWDGNRGFISKFGSDGERLLCAWAKNEGPALLEWVNDRWQVLAGIPLAGPSMGEMNNISDLTIYRGEPVVGGVFHDGIGGDVFGLAIWRGGQWWRTKDALAEVRSFVGTKDYLWVREFSRTMIEVKTLINDNLKKLRSGVFPASWKGELKDVQMVEPGSIEAAISLRKRCFSKPYRGPALVNLPWPKGVKFQKRGSDLKPWEQLKQPGWRLSEWPKETTPDSLVQSNNGAILISEYLSRSAWVGNSLQFCFKAEANSRLAISFDFKITNPKAWQDSTLGYLDGPNDGIPRWSPDQSWPYAYLESHPRYDKGSRILYPVHDGWNTASFSTKKVWQGRFLALSFGPRIPKDSGGAIEIRNLNIAEINPTPDEILGGLEKAIKANYLPVPGEENDLDGWFDPLHSEIRNADLDSVYTIIKHSWRGQVDPSIRIENRYVSGFIGGLYLPSQKAEVQAEKEDSIRQHLINWHDGRGWVTDGIVYYHGAIATGLRQDFYHDQSILVTDWQAIILDFRSREYNREYSNGYRHHPKGPVLSQILAGTDFKWGYITKGSDMNLENARPMTVKADTKIQLPSQIFVLTDEFTSGYMVEMLKHMPNVTTVGCPSRPIDRPTDPFPLQDGGWVYLPTNWILDADGKNISNQRILPDILIGESASYDAPFLKALEMLGIEIAEPQFCPLD